MVISMIIIAANEADHEGVRFGHYAEAKDLSDLIGPVLSIRMAVASARFSS